MNKLLAKFSAAILVTAVLAPALALAAPSLVYVDDSCPVGVPDGTPAHPYCTIQAGVNAVATGGTVKVLPGTYNEDVNVNKQVLLMGPQQNDARGRNVPASQEAVVDGTNNDFLVNAANVSILGFTIQGASVGINLISGASGVLISRNIIQGNAEGIYLGGDGVKQQTIQLNNIRNNNATGAASGSGIYTDQVLNAFVDTNAFSGNSSSDFTSTGFSGVTGSVRFSRNTSNNSGSMTNWYNTDNSVIDSNNAANGSFGFMIFLGGGNDNLQITRNQLHDNTQWGGIGVRDLGPGPNTGLYIDSNVVLRNAYDGILLADSAVSGSANQLTRNQSDSNQGDGIHLGTGLSGAKLDSNHMHSNVVFDAQDESAPANTWTRNGCTTSSPPGLCAFP